MRTYRLSMPRGCHSQNLLSCAGAAPTVGAASTLPTRTAPRAWSRRPAPRSGTSTSASKAALAGVTASVADWLAERGILLNTVNPGPVNTGYLDEETRDRPSEVLREVLARFPGGRFGEPDDPARLVAWLASDEGRWVVGQVVSTEGGFRRA